MNVSAKMLFGTAIIAFCALLISCSGKSFLSKGRMEIPYLELTHSYMSEVENKTLVFKIGEEIVKQQPVWSPGLPLVIPVDKITLVSKSELVKYTKDPSMWQIQTISVDRIVCSNNEPEKWVYLVSFRCRNKTDYINIPILFDCKPVGGVFL